MIKVTRCDLTEDVLTGEVDITPVPDHMEGRFVTYEDYESVKIENYNSGCLSKEQLEKLRELIDNVRHTNVMACINTRPKEVKDCTLAERTLNEFLITLTK